MSGKLSDFAEQMISASYLIPCPAEASSHLRLATSTELSLKNLKCPHCRFCLILPATETYKMKIMKRENNQPPFGRYKPLFDECKPLLDKC